MVDQIRAATNGNNVFGGSKFAVEVEAMIARRVQRGSPGRPKKIDHLVKGGLSPFFSAGARTARK